MGSCFSNLNCYQRWKIPIEKTYLPSPLYPDYLFYIGPTRPIMESTFGHKVDII